MAAQSSAAQGTVRGRRRSEISHKAILRAAMELLSQGDYKSVTIEAIAAKAGVGKQTIYRWWPSRAAVLLEAYVEEASTSVPSPETGSLRTDLLKCLQISFASLQGTPARILRELAAEAQIDAEFEEAFRRAFVLPMLTSLAEILSRAHKRGELSADVDDGVLTEMIVGAQWFRLLFDHAPLDAHLAVKIADLVERLMPPRARQRSKRT